MKPFTVTYSKAATGMTIHEASFDNLEDAQLFWDSIFYLRNAYKPLTTRPR